MLAAGCGDPDRVEGGAPDPRAASPPIPQAATSPPPEAVLSPLADLVRPIGSALSDPAEHDRGVAPVRVSVEGIGVDDVAVRDVGLEPNVEMEIPPGEEIGWYRLSPAPGRPGSAVLAGHIAWNGRDGAFRRLADARPGAQVTVELADGTRRVFEVVSVEQYPKDGLPLELFRTDGFPVLTLITCGGAFQPSLRSYEDNVVVQAVPVA